MVRIHSPPIFPAIPRSALAVYAHVDTTDHCSLLQAWLARDRAEARDLLADDLKFRSPSDNSYRADEFLAACWHYAGQFAGIHLEHTLYDEAEAYITFHVGGIVVGEFHRIRNGKICEVYVTFNGTV